MKIARHDEFLETGGISGPPFLIYNSAKASDVTTAKKKSAQTGSD